MDRKVAVIDLDGTICDERKTFERSLAILKPGAREVINHLYDTDWRIIIFTARGWAEYEMTLRWLNDNDVHFDELIMGKPIYDLWIDDKAMSARDWEDLLGSFPYE